MDLSLQMGEDMFLLNVLSAYSYLLAQSMVFIIKSLLLIGEKRHIHNCMYISLGRW